MRTSWKTDFRKLKITLVATTYPCQRPQCPSLSPYVLLKNRKTIPTKMTSKTVIKPTENVVAVILTKTCHILAFSHACVFG